MCCFIHFFLIHKSRREVNIIFSLAILLHKCLEWTDAGRAGGNGKTPMGGQPEKQTNFEGQVQKLTANPTSSPAEAP